MRKFVKKYVASCLNCQYYKHHAAIKQEMLHPIERVARPSHTLRLDHVGPFVTSHRTNTFLLVIVIELTKFTILEPVKSTQNQFFVFAVKIFIRTSRRIL